MYLCVPSQKGDVSVETDANQYNMKTFGIVAEYNPFHNGHAWQINEARRILGPDCAAVAVMSGSFTQRGEPGIMNKWDRAAAAMSCGVDLVIELPQVFASASAGRFAQGGIELLAATGVVQTIIFGSESGNIEGLKHLAEALSEESGQYKQILRSCLNQGKSWPAARQQAAAAVVGTETASLLERSNNILAVEYLQALARLDRRRRPRAMTLPRQGCSYNSTDLPDNLSFASASAIRQEIARQVNSEDPGSLEARLASLLSSHMPPASLAVMLASSSAGRKLILPEDLAPQIITQLRATDPIRLDQYAHMQEGLGRRLAEAARRPCSCQKGRLAALLEQADTRRFPRTRIQRALVALLMQIEADNEIAMHSSPHYIRVLGFNKKGRHLLKLMRKYASLPIITRASDFLEFGRDSQVMQQASYDLLATDIRALSASLSCGLDFDTEVVIS